MSDLEESLQETVEQVAEPRNEEFDEMTVETSTNVFALTPAQATQGLIDFGQKAGLTLWTSGVKALAKPYDGKREHLGVFMDSVWNRIVVMSWQQINQVWIGDEQLNIVKDYGRIPIKKVVELADAAKLCNNRSKQNRSMMGQFLVASVQGIIGKTQTETPRDLQERGIL